MKSEYPQHTPELAHLLHEMLVTGEALKRASHRLDFAAAIRSPEYRANKAAYKAYWAAVNADRLANT